MLWVAEVGSAHKGVPSLAYEYIRAFSEAGANVLKFQFGWTKEAQEAQGLEYNPVRYVDEWAPDLKKWCQLFNVKLEASIWSKEGLSTAANVNVDYYKIGRNMTDQKLIDRIYYLAEHSGKRVFHSGKLINHNVFCVSKYPTYPYEFHMPADFHMEYGYSDHTHGIAACLMAVARWAVYIEKHVCLDKTDLVTKDTPFSATPAEFEQMVKIGNGMRRLIDASA